MPKKVVIKVSMNGEKPRSFPARLLVDHVLKPMLPACLLDRMRPTASEIQKKVMTAAAGFSGVTSTAITGDDRNQLVVEGDVDAVNLAMKLRTKVTSALILSVVEAGSEKNTKKEEPPKKNDPAPTPHGGPPTWQFVELQEYPSYGPCCSIM